MGGPSPAKPNLHIEKWALMRENIEHTFRFTPKNLVVCGVFGVVVPVLFYTGFCAENYYHDKRNGRTERKFL